MYKDKYIIRLSPYPHTQKIEVSSFDEMVDLVKNYGKKIAFIKHTFDNADSTFVSIVSIEDIESMLENAKETLA